MRRSTGELPSSSEGSDWTTVFTFQPLEPDGVSEEFRVGLGLRMAGLAWICMRRGLCV